MKMHNEYEFKRLNTKQIEFDPDYQRRTDPREIAEILKDFDPRVVNVIKVSYRDGRYFCIDGGHTISALKTKNNGRDLLVDCKVFYGLTKLDEKELFKKQNGAARRVSIEDKLRADFQMGDPDVVRFVRVAEKCGIIVSFDHCKGTNKVVAVGALYKIFQDAEFEEDFTSFLNTIKGIWGGEPESLRKEIMNGLWLFMKVYKGEYNKQLFVKKLSRISPKTIIREANVSTASGNRKYATQFLNAYNANMSKNRLPDLL